MQEIFSHVLGRWVAPGPGAREIADAATGRVFARAGNDSLDFAAVLEFARARGGPLCAQ